MKIEKELFTLFFLFYQKIFGYSSTNDQSYSQWRFEKLSTFFHPNSIYLIHWKTVLPTQIPKNYILNNEINFIFKYLVLFKIRNLQLN